MATFVDYSQPVDPRTGNRPTLNGPRPNFGRERADELNVKEIARILNSVQDNIYDLLRAAIDLPFGGPSTYLKNVPFVSGTNVSIDHRIPVAPARGAPGIGVTVADTPAQIRAQVLHKSAFGDVRVVSADTRTITLVSNANLTADVLLWVVP